MTGIRGHPSTRENSWRGIEDTHERDGIQFGTPTDSCALQVVPKPAGEVTAPEIPQESKFEVDSWLSCWWQGAPAR